MNRWSPEVRVLRSPSATFRELASEAGLKSPSYVLRRPLLLLLAMGGTVALQASGRVSARLVFDGMVAFAFVPIFELAALALVYRRAPRPVTLADAVDAFFVANAPWLVWMLAINLWRTFLTPAQASTMTEVPFSVFPLSVIPVAVWSTYIDRQFFREFLGTERGRHDLILQRVISWGCITAYFAGHELWEPIAIWIRF